MPDPGSGESLRNADSRRKAFGSTLNRTPWPSPLLSSAPNTRAVAAEEASTISPFIRPSDSRGCATPRCRCGPERLARPGAGEAGVRAPNNTCLRGEGVSEATECRADSDVRIDGTLVGQRVDAQRHHLPAAGRHEPTKSTPRPVGAKGARWLAMPSPMDEERREARQAFLDRMPPLSKHSTPFDGARSTRGTRSRGVRWASSATRAYLCGMWCAEGWEARCACCWAAIHCRSASPIPSRCGCSETSGSAGAAVYVGPTSATSSRPRAAA